MRLTNTAVLASVIALALGTAGAEETYKTYTWVPGSTDWNSEDSYEEPGKPGEHDSVLIPSGHVATNKVVAGDAASLASFEVFAKLAAVRLETATSSIVLDVDEGLVLTNNCRITCAAGTQTGLIRKIGAGEIEFGYNADANAYNCNITIEEGTLVLPQKMTMSESVTQLGSVVVSNGATLVTAIDAAVDSGTGRGATMVVSLNGAGEITNRCARGRRLGFYAAGRTSNFSGRIRPRVLIWPASYEGVNVNLTGTESDTYESIYLAYGATLGAAKFGLRGSPSSLGRLGSLIWRSGGTGGTFKYLGDGEDETDKDFYVWRVGGGPVGIDGGKGGLKLTGTVSWNSGLQKESYGMHQLTLSGDGTLTNVFAGTLPTWTYQTTNYNFHVTKKGAGVWRFADKAQTHSGAWTVENGTLQFESIKEMGQVCSLGTATNCMESYSGLVDESKRVDWAFKLGGASTAGTLEYVGEENAFCKTRPILLAGKGGTLKNSSGRQLVFGGVSAASGESVALTLAGDTVVTNEIWDVTDGEGTTSLVKDGSGTWALCGTNNSFSGMVTVKEGTLLVRNMSACNYDWFKWTIKERGAVKSDQLNIRASEFGIYDGENKRMNHALRTYAAYGSKAEGSMPAGMAGYWHPKMLTESNANRPLAALFDDGDTSITGATYVWTQMGLPNGEPDIDTEATWIPVVMHLADNHSRAATFDVAQRTSGSGYYAYKTFSMSGSLDGIHWDVLTNVTLTTFPQSDWTFSGGTPTKGSAAMHTGGCPIAGGPEGTANALDGVRASFSVAEGARLVAQGAATIPALTVDANGAGTIEGFVFAENGTLTVRNMPKGGGTLPGAYVNCIGLENIGGWALYDADKGRVARGSTIAVSDGEIRIIAPGSILYVR